MRESLNLDHLAKNLTLIRTANEALGKDLIPWEMRVMIHNEVADGIGDLVGQDISDSDEFLRKNRKKSDEEKGKRVYRVLEPNIEPIMRDRISDLPDFPLPPSKSK